MTIFVFVFVEEVSENVDFFDSKANNFFTFGFNVFLFVNIWFFKIWKIIKIEKRQTKSLKMDIKIFEFFWGSGLC